MSNNTKLRITDHGEVVLPPRLKALHFLCEAFFISNKNAQVLSMIRDCHPDHKNSITHHGWIFCLVKIEFLLQNEKKQKAKPD